MKKALKTLILVLLPVVLLLQTPILIRGEPNEKRFTITTTITYSNTNNETTTWDLTGEDYAIGLFMNNSWQSVSLVEHSLPLNSTRPDTDGNLLGFLNLTRLNPGQSVSFTVKYDIVSKPRLLPMITEEQSENLSDIPPNLNSTYCKKEGPWLTDDSNLRALAFSLAGNEKKVLTIVKNLVRWIADNIDYHSEEFPQYPNETRKNRTGDCDDQAILLITLCRILGIPAFLQVGAIYDPRPPTNNTYWQGHVTSVLRHIGWHGWTIVYIPPWGWLPVDLTYVPVDPYLINPLNAISGAAVAGQDVIQYMNFTHSDYVGASRHLMDFIQSNDFYVYILDEMMSNADFVIMWEHLIPVFRGVLIATAVIAVSLAAVFVLKWKKNSDSSF